MLLITLAPFIALAVLAGADKTPQLERRALAHSEPFYPSPWADPNANGWEDAYAKAKDFVSQLTLLEKVNLTTGVGWQGEQCVGQVGSIPRLGFRSLCMQDSPMGVRLSDYNSAFPSGQTAAATFDKGLLYRRGLAMGQEHRGKGVTVQLGPVAGPLGRAPAGGRNWEGFSPDPVLTGIGMAETVKGIQDAGVIACAKHFIGNEQAQGYGYNISETLSSNIDDKTMHELYLWPFADAVRAGVGSVMCSYQQINNSYGCQNSKMLNDLLKNELGFQGFVMSDWQAQHTGAASAVAGLDMTMPGDTVFNSGLSFWGANLTLAVINGTVPEWRIDDMALRIMAAFFKVGLTVDQDPINFDSWTLDTYGPLHYAAKDGYQQINWHVNVQGQHASLIREVAAKGTVLLKNTGVLPLNKPKFIAVIGEDAGPNPAGPNGCGDRGCDDGTLGAAWGSGTANYPYLITPDSAIQAQAVKDGSRYESILNNYKPDQIKALVSQQDATSIVFVNADSGEGYINVDGNEGDRKNLTLWKDGDALVKNVSSWSNNTIVVIHSVGPVLVTDWYNSPNITAILWAGLPGQESGNSITDILYGKTNPSGRTPFTWGTTRESYGTDVLYEPNNGNGAPQDDFSEGVFIDYRYFDKNNDTPIYEFGYGLSYTTFGYSDIKVEKTGAGTYKPTTGTTASAPTFGNFSTDLNDYVFPKDDIRYIYQYIYPYLNTSSSGEAASADPYYGQTAEEFLPPHATDGSPQPLLRASGKSNPGGNRQLYDVLYHVSATITNTGSIVGDEVPQLYVSLGGPDDPPVVLRGFDRIRIDPGQSATFKADITRRDLSNWDIVSQDWVVSSYPKKVYIGKSSRKLELSADLS
ncbi:putative beta-glucosidase 1 precursor protein [Phaeoacremonium minimum UCRPA7]|uniref:Beta-glucosidase cel3A n=1 Tax=Phaeoacremonium minimum (strain UCR-PA7) TaxID=1286976 RepID=R8BV55_PHAM7|nr:putative beta-glucosidase 1 precursor protein [Phaeoacremonium minimum UCRPA7]EOO03200.1 putative beta-glucosidase 1 precursor protein [Phaeoacremonium minimum UCRPA7]